MYKLNIFTAACMQASLPISADIAHYLTNRHANGDISRENLLKTLGYPVGVGQNSGSFLDSVYNFANAILKESNAEQFKVQIEAIPAHQKETSIFKGNDCIPEEGRSVVVIFVDKKIETDVSYCSDCKAWHAVDGNLKVNRIHQWAYSDEFFNSLNLPEFPETKTKKDKTKEDIADVFAHLILLKALLSSAKSNSENNPRSFF
ncbi:hypothetical protein [Acinetobacter calcoaceticus]|uniref:hypothetical protein n=1 Tax=Acinetobacter calcoaceticus TaxID=471 RepID=UPI0018DD37FA|nr:hypothetical protein [Acinetobacter calcoaceticus]